MITLFFCCQLSFQYFYRNLVRHSIYATAPYSIDLMPHLYFLFLSLSLSLLSTHDQEILMILGWMECNYIWKMECMLKFIPSFLSFLAIPSMHLSLSLSFFPFRGWLWMQAICPFDAMVYHVISFQSWMNQSRRDMLFKYEWPRRHQSRKVPATKLLFYEND